MSRRIRDINGPNDNVVLETLETTGAAVIGGTLAVSGGLNVTGAIAGAAQATNTSGAGTVTTAATTTAEEFGDGVNHVTKLTLTAFSLGNGADNADLAIGAEVYTFPAGDLVIYDSSIRGAFTSLASVTTIADGEYGMGTLIGSTAVDTLAEVNAAAENIMTGQAVSTYAADGTSVVVHSTATGDTPSANGLVVLAASGLAHKLFLNFAATWPNSAAAAGFTFTGVITVRWRKIS
jgi:hypothetical protein